MKWISVKDSLPNHSEKVIAYNPKEETFVVTVFLDSKKLNELMEEKKYPGERIDVKIKPYCFSSQENIGNIFPDISHWMPIPIGTGQITKIDNIKWKGFENDDFCILKRKHLSDEETIKDDFDIDEIAPVIEKMNVYFHKEKDQWIIEISISIIDKPFCIEFPKETTSEQIEKYIKPLTELLHKQKLGTIYH